MPIAAVGFLALFALDHLLATDFTALSARTLLPQSIALELIAMLAVFVWLARRRAEEPRALVWALTGSVFALGLLRLVSYLVPAYFGRPFSAASDLGLAPVLYHLVREALGSTRFFIAAASVFLGAVFLLVALRWMIGLLWRLVGERRYQPIALLAGLTAVGWTLAATDREAEWTPKPIEVKAAGLLYEQVEQMFRAESLRQQYRQEIARRVAGRSGIADLGKLAGRPVLLVFIESYGAITLSDPGFRERLAPARAYFARRLEEAGYHVYSDMLVSPVIGGGSWFAHASLTSGVRIDDQLHYDALIGSQAPMLAGYLARAGYDSVAAMPRMEKPWPEGRSFGFERIYTEAAFDYAGPRYSWRSIPDQFVLETIHRRELGHVDRPRFLQYVLASSHAAFDLIPPVVEDWGRLGDGSLYRDLGADAHPLPPGGIFENEPGYLAAIDYDLRVLADYLAKRLSEHGLVILLGDHQPPLNRVLSAGERSVPIHVLSRDADLLEPFRRAGWAEGVLPSRSAAADGMETFLERFLTGFSTAAAPAAAATGGPSTLR
ncbi:MAG: hypothetical protein HYR63_08335 [Proteobacteria bacterium]|nr:hypothetical protein [Pseudomonadota bacterium]MBI3497710.1 hypothetical protein [Pseudomonadota bacterium]